MGGRKAGWEQQAQEEKKGKRLQAQENLRWRVGARAFRGAARTVGFTKGAEKLRGVYCLVPKCRYQIGQDVGGGVLGLEAMGAEGFGSVA